MGIFYRYIAWSPTKKSSTTKPIAENQNIMTLKWIDFILRAITKVSPSLKATKTITSTPTNLAKLPQLLS